MTIFHDGDAVEWAGGGGFRAEGHIIAAGTNSAHVKWASGPDSEHITLVNLFDIEPVTAKLDDPFHLTAVRNAYDNSQEVGVLNFLASNNYLDSWTGIASDILVYAESCIRKDASMELVDEQLTGAEKQAVVTAAALALLRDAFGE